jgi:hypothetical protein
METTLENKRPCSYCKKEWIDHDGATWYNPIDPPFCFYSLSNNLFATYIPMDNLDYIEYLAKQKGLVV